MTTTTHSWLDSQLLHYYFLHYFWVGEGNQGWINNFRNDEFQSSGIRGEGVRGLNKNYEWRWDVWWGSTGAGVKGKGGVVKTPELRNWIPIDRIIIIIIWNRQPSSIIDNHHHGNHHHNKKKCLGINSIDRDDDWGEWASPFLGQSNSRQGKETEMQMYAQGKQRNGGRVKKCEQEAWQPTTTWTDWLMDWGVEREREGRKEVWGVCSFSQAKITLHTHTHCSSLDDHPPSMCCMYVCERRWGEGEGDIVIFIVGWINLNESLYWFPVAVGLDWT